MTGELVANLPLILVCATSSTQTQTEAKGKEVNIRNLATDTSTTVGKFMKYYSAKICSHARGRLCLGFWASERARLVLPRRGGEIQ